MRVAFYEIATSMPNHRYGDLVSQCDDTSGREVPHVPTIEAHYRGRDAQGSRRVGGELVVAADVEYWRRTVQASDDQVGSWSGNP